MAPGTSDLTFENLELVDLEWARQLHNDPEVLSMLTDPRVVTPGEQLEWFYNLGKRSLRWVFKYEGKKVGLMRLDYIDTANHSLSMGLDIHKDFRGKGFAKPIYRTGMNYWFNQGMHRIWLTTAAFNAKGVHIYSSLGFREVGRYRQSLYKNGQYFDELVMDILREEYVPTSI